MAEVLLETVEKLQSRLSESQESRKLLKTLKRLGELPMTVNILVETGVGKTVNSLRKHDVVGPAAKSLVAQWKTLVPQPVERTSSVKVGSVGRDSTHKRTREPSPEEPQYMEEEEAEVAEEEDEDDVRGNHARYSPSPSPPHHHYSPRHGNGGRGGYQSEEYESPPPSPQRHHAKPHKERGLHGNRETDRQTDRQPRRHKQQQQQSGEGKKGSGQSEQQSASTHKSSKHSRQGGKEAKKEKKGTAEGKAREHKDEEDEPFEPPTMSFESFLNYDAPAPTKKKKKPPRPVQTIQPPHSVPPTISTPAPAPKTTQKPSKESKRSKRTEPPATHTPEKRRKVVDVVPTLPDIPLPAIQPNYRPLPSIEPSPLSPQRRKAAVSNEEEDAGFTGRRFNSKMVVYSGSKTAYLPKMMSLYEQCIRVLQNNIDSIEEVGGIPFEILEPVLERCTPEQLYRIEQCNQYFTEDSDELWMRHCQRDFKRETQQEFESWREMYLRLHEAREERLRMLTQNISSAHANRPKGRQVKMAYVNSVAKPPRDVRRRQEKFGTSSISGSSSGPSSGPSAIRIRPATVYGSQASDSAHSSQCVVPPPPRPAGPLSHNTRDKPQVKKIAPMMAKTIKAFKNRFSRR